MQYTLLKFLTRLLSRLPWPALRRTAGFAAFCFWHLAPSRRREAIEAVRNHLKVPDEEAGRIARQSFRENFLSFLEILHTGRFYTEQSVRVVHHPEIKEALRREKAPIVIVTAHLGSWELMPGLAADIVPQRRGMVVVRSRRSRILNRVMAELRGARGMEAVDHRRASEIIVPGLREGGAVAFLADHNASRKEAVFLPFLEDTAAVNMGPASMALRTKAAVYPVFLLRDGEGGHILHFLPPLHTENLEGSIRERIRTVAAFYTDAVAGMVRMYPEQWLWMHRRWKTRPLSG
ncbi:MAG: lysophospholipid acyltransferase family protein [Desulfovibrio sp.]|jgi:KDO2-lipid IV(A) lauroyltransferase|nr:lysophospholipid acyltransferase family protein [Desulfovibrio sp.]